MKNPRINNAIWKIWEKYAKDPAYSEVTNKLPLFYDDFDGIENILLVVGSNPSFNPKHIKKYKINLDFKRAKENVIEKERVIDQIVEFENTAVKEYPTYYGKIENLAKETGFGNRNKKNGWLPMDLFLCRITNQKYLEEAIFSNVKKKKELKKFGRAQINIAFDIIKLVKPSIILVANAMASKVLINEGQKRNWWGINKDETPNSDPDLGTPVAVIGNRRVPVFFSSALSGGHLDNGSYYRLIWHINFVKKKQKKNEIGV